MRVALRFAAAAMLFACGSSPDSNANATDVDAEQDSVLVDVPSDDADAAETGDDSGPEPDAAIDASEPDAVEDVGAADAAEDTAQPDAETDAGDGGGERDSGGDVDDVHDGGGDAPDASPEVVEDADAGGPEVDAAPACEDESCPAGERCVDDVCTADCSVEPNCPVGYACVDGTCSEPSCSCEDGDSDGYYSVDCEDVLCVPRTDCNDGEGSVNPGGVEVCGNGLDDDCFGGDEACPTCPSGDGLYCGGNGVEGESDYLYYCEAGELFFRAVCLEGCQYNPPGTNDACNPGTCPFGSGFYCGPIVDLAENTLLNCVGGAYYFQETCMTTCVVADPGFNDYCE